MTTQKLVSLTAVAAVLAGLAYYSNTREKVKTPTQSGKPVLSGLDLSDVSKIEAGSAGGKKLVLEGSDSGWVIRSLFSYPADITKIRENLLALKDLKIGHVATGKKLGAPVFGAWVIMAPIVKDRKDLRMKPCAATMPAFVPSIYTIILEPS